MMTGLLEDGLPIFVWRKCGIEGVLKLFVPPPSLSPVPAMAMASLTDASFIYNPSPIPSDCRQ